MKFIGGVLDGKDFNVDEPYLNVPVENGVWVNQPNKVVEEYQVYVRNGNVYELQEPTWIAVDEGLEYFEHPHPFRGKREEWSTRTLKIVQDGLGSPNPFLKLL